MEPKSEPEFGFRFLSPGLWGRRVVQIIQRFLFFNEPNRSGARTKNVWMLGQEPNTLDALGAIAKLKKQEKDRYHHLCELVLLKAH